MSEELCITLEDGPVVIYRPEVETQSDQAHSELLMEQNSVHTLNMQSPIEHPSCECHPNELLWEQNSEERSSMSSNKSIMSSSTNSHVCPTIKGVWKILSPYVVGCVLPLFRIIMFYADVGTDLALAVSYFYKLHYIWGSLTLAFVVVPSVVISIMNLIFYYKDYKYEKKEKKLREFRGKEEQNPNLLTSSMLWTFRVVFTAIQMGPVLRNIESFLFFMKSRRTTNSERRKHFSGRSDEVKLYSCLLSLLECFMESAPQLSLQLYIIMTKAEKTLEPLRNISMIISWITICYSLTSFYRAMYWEEKKKVLPVCASIVYFLWRLVEVGPRIVIIVMFISQYHYWTIVPLLIHVVIIFLFLQIKAEICCKINFYKTIFNMVWAFISIFCFFDMDIMEGYNSLLDTSIVEITRCQSIVFHVIFYAENIVFLTLWFHFTNHKGTWYHITVLYFMVCCAVLHVIFFSCYYYCCNPRTRANVITKWCNRCKKSSCLCTDQQSGTTGSIECNDNQRESETST